MVMARVAGWGGKKGFGNVSSVYLWWNPLLSLAIAPLELQAS